MKSGKTHRSLPGRRTTIAIETCPASLPLRAARLLAASWKTERTDVAGPERGADAAVGLDQRAARTNEPGIGDNDADRPAELPQHADQSIRHHSRLDDLNRSEAGSLQVVEEISHSRQARGEAQRLLHLTI